MILSGEHSVVYGAEAIAVAAQRYTSARFTPVSQSKVINTLFSGISTGVSYPLAALSKLKHKLDDRFESFAAGELAVQHILTHPNDLAMYALCVVMDQLPTRRSLSPYLPDSGILRTSSTIPEGAGMGSSASVIAATIVLFEHILQRPLSVDQRFEMVRFCERLQHGRGSAIDAASVTYGGVNRLNEHGHERVDVALDNNWFWLYTGAPRTSTGESVAFVRRYYAMDESRWQDFDAVTKTLVTQISNSGDIGASISANHDLLCSIGVVPDAANRLIRSIGELGGFAKVSGAGAVAGDNAGLILVYHPGDFASCVTELEKRHPGYIQEWDALHIAHSGAELLTPYTGSGLAPSAGYESANGFRQSDCQPI